MDKQQSIPNSPSPLTKAFSSKPDEATSHQSFSERWLIFPKLLYFVLNLFVYSLHSLIFDLFIYQWGFKYYMYGFATTIYALNFFGAMIWTSLADKTGRYKAIIVVTSVIDTIIGCFMLSFKTGSKDEVLTIGKMILVLSGFGAYNFFLSAAFPLLDAMILGMLTSMPGVNREQFVNQRIWGAVGHFAATLLSLTVRGASEKTAMPLIIFQLVVSVIFIAVVWLVVKDVQPVRGGHHHGSSSEKKGLVSPSPSPSSSSPTFHQVPVAQAMNMAPTPAPPSAADELSAEGQAGQKHPVITLFLNPSFMFFMVFVACLGVVRSVSSSFQKPIMMSIKDKKAAPIPGEEWKKYFETAMVDLARMASEIFVYLVSKPMKAFMGIYWVLIFSQVMGIARILGYYFIPLDNKKVAYGFSWGLELIKGFSSGLVSSSAIPIASRIAPPGCENTAQGLFSGNYSGLSMALGGLIGGEILRQLYRYHPDKEQDNLNQAIDAQTMFFWVSIGSSVVTVLMALKYIFVDRVCGLPGFPRRRSI